MKQALFLIALLLFFRPGFAQQTFPENPVQGARLFSEKGCFRCHSILGQGGRIGHDLGKIQLKGTRLNVASALLNNARTMEEKMQELKIVRSHLTGEEVERLIAYLYYVNYFDDPGDAARGKALFQTKGCARCHATGTGGAPSLAQFPRNISPIYLAKTLWNHGPRMRSEMSRLGMPWPRFEGAELMDLVTYMKGAAGGTTKIAANPPGDPNDGRKVFRDKGCPRCHGGEGEKPPNLADPARGLQENLTQTVSRLWNHAPQMFARAGEIHLKTPIFTEKEMADLVSYIYFLNYFDPAPDPAVGRRLFVAKQCSSCHSLGGAVRGIGPDLATIRNTASAIEIVAAIWNHVPLMQAVMREQKIPWPHFEKGELNDLLGYLQSLRK